MIGIDEVGRGAWAGPLLVVAASGNPPSAAMDSKALTAKKRSGLIAALEATCEFGQGWVSASEVDEFGLTSAMRLGVERALVSLGAQPHDNIIMDGPINYCDSRYAQVETIIKADASIPLVSAASIYAKVLRDQYMKQLEETMPGYGFGRHVGYGTKMHRDALTRLGVSRHHRTSYKPVKALL